MLRKKAFTLIELLVVISIIALLIAILMPALNMAREQSKRVVCTVNLRSIGLALRIYEDDNDLLLPPPYHLAGNNKPAREEYDTSYSGYAPWYSYLAYNDEYRDSDGERIPVQLAKLHNGNLLDNPEILYCPCKGFKMTSTHFNAMYYTYDYYIEKGPWGSYIPSGDNRVRLNYNYWLHGKKTLDELKNKPIVFDMVHHWRSINHIKNNVPQGINVLYSDGHASFSTKEDVFDINLWGGGFDAAQYEGPGHKIEDFKEIVRQLGN